MFIAPRFIALRSRTLKALLVAAVAVLAARPTHAQGLVTQRNLSLAMARTIADATLEECRSKGFHTAVAVVDRAGQLLVLMRDEATSAHVGEMARRKAYTAKTYGIPTMDFQKRTMPDTPLAGQRNFPDILPLSGGVPIKIGRETIGAVGSAGSNLEQDDACAKAGVAKVADLLK